MTVSDILKQTEDEMKKTITAYQEALMKIKTGRANPNMLNGVKINYYGTMTPLEQTASISAPDPQMIIVKPYDKSQIGEVVTGINKADLGLNPIPDAEVVRIPVPALTEDVRKETVKRMYKELETFKVRIRSARRDGMDLAKKEDEISEDMQRDLEKQIQTLTDNYIKQLDEMSAKKETALMTI